jgi:23S rRNA pseudouridine2605 synthase
MAVSRLIRIRYGSVVLPKGLKRGVWVDLDDSDVRRLRQLAGAEQGQRDGGQQGQRDGGQPAQRDGQQVRGKGGNGGPGRNDRGPRGDKGPGQNAGGPQQGKNRNGRDRDRGRNRQEQGSPAPFREPGDPSFIPNPLQQTFDRRAIQQRERPVVATHYDDDEDGPIGPIPNPLQQTYDKRFVQGNRDAFGGKRKGGGGGGGGAQKQPDPLKTAVGYIGADAFVKKLNSRGGRGRR